MALSVTQVKALGKPGRYTDGGGLHLYVSKGEASPGCSASRSMGAGATSDWVDFRR